LGDEVQSAAVAVLDEQLVAFIVGKLTETHMRETLAQRLPHYMVPDRLIKLDKAMPRLVSGKIDRKALAALFTKEDAEKMAASETIIDMGKFTQAIFL
jgi:acyl-coenzyme A synthetase/AMP-(fatty) acid ligase